MGFLEARAKLRGIAWRFPVSIPLRGYIVGKLALDPAFHAVADLLRETGRPVIDVGCGFGLLAHSLRSRGCNLPIHGIDVDARKIELAREAAANGNLKDVTFAVGGAGDMLPRDATVVLLDVIHYLGADSQRRYLSELAERHSLVLLRTAPRDGSWRHRLVRIQEWWTRASGWIPVKENWNFSPAEFLTAPFAEAGWTVESRPMWGHTPFNSRLLVFRRAENSVANTTTQAAQA